MRNLLACFRLTLLCLVPAMLHAQAEIGADVNLGVTARFGGNPEDFARLGSLTYFRACERTHGCELWQTDGTSAGTVLLADICPGTCSSRPSGLRVTFNSTIYFSADDGSHGAEPWQYRPDLGRPRLVADVNPGALASSPSGFISVSNGSLAGVFFFATIGHPNGGANTILRSTEGGGQVFVTEALAPGTLRNFGSPVLLADRLYFRALSDSLGTGTELWTLRAVATNQFAAAPTRDIFPGVTGSSIEQLTAHPTLARVFFRATDVSGNSELWKSDGSAAGTVPVKDIRAGALGSVPNDLVVFGNRLFFTANDATLSNGNNREPWISDGTTLGTGTLAEIGTGATGSDPRHPRVFGNRVLFIANDGSSGLEFYASDGTTAGTARIVDLQPGATGFTPSSFDSSPALVHGGFYYLASGARLFRTDGTVAGSRQVGPEFTDLIDGVRDLQGAGERVLFTLNTFAESNELFQTRVDTPAQAGPLHIIGDQVGHSDPELFHELAGGRIFLGYDDVEGVEWRRLEAGSTAGLLVDLSPGDNFFSPLNRVPVRSDSGPAKLWFAANFNQVWITDGSASGTLKIFDTATLPVPGASVRCVVPRGTGAIILTRDFSLGRVELWSSDATAQGAVQLLAPENLPSDTTLDDLYCPFVAGNTILLGAFRDGIGTELFRSNGNAGNLTLLRDIAPGTETSFASRPKRIGAVTYFVATDGINGANAELWRSDGTSQGTRPVIELNPVGAADPHALTVFGDELLFVGNDGSSGFELYRTDGTAAGTARVADLYPGPGSAFSNTSPVAQPPIAVTSGRAIFAATVDGSDAGSHLHASDGTEVGTRRLRPPAATAPLVPQDVIALPDGGVLFSGFTPQAGREPWFSDGTDAGTMQVADIAPGPLGSGPTGLAPTGDGAMFAANDGERGREPWVVTLTQEIGIFGDGFEP